MPRKSAGVNIVSLCRLLNILANFSNLFLHTGKQCGAWSDCSYWSGSTLQKRLLKSQADDKADDSCCDWQFKSLTYFICISSVTYTNNNIIVNINIQMGFEKSCATSLTSSLNKSQNSRFFCDHIRAYISGICLNCSVKDRSFITNKKKWKKYRVYCKEVEKRRV